MSKVKLQCLNCNETFERYKSNIRNDKHFCCKKCMIEFKKAEKEKRICKNCNNTFFVYKSAIEKTNTSGNFCTRKCYSEFLKENLKGENNNNYSKQKCFCPSCGKEFLQIPSKIKNYKNVFCSKECKNKFMFNYIGGDKNYNWVGGHSEYRGDFEKVKKQLFAEKQFCAVCGTFENIHIHHIIPFRITQDNSFENLIPLCRKHHKEIESATLPFINLTEDKKQALYFLNLILRERQLLTSNLLKGKDMST